MKTIQKTTRSGFTLIELLTVIAIIGILAAIIIPTVGAVRKTARTSVCASNLRQVTLAMRLYADANKSAFPPARSAATANPANQDWTAALAPYLPVPPSGRDRHDVYKCPDMDYGPTVTLSSHSYSMGGGAGLNAFNNDNDGAQPRRLSTIVTPSRTPLLLDGGWNGSVNFAGARNSVTHANVLTSINEPDPQTNFSTAMVFRHKSAANLSFADGSVRRMTRAQLLADFSIKAVWIGRQ